VADRRRLADELLDARAEALARRDVDDPEPPGDSHRWPVVIMHAAAAATLTDDRASWRMRAVMIGAFALGWLEALDGLTVPDYPPADTSREPRGGR
jgi:hypothetical protein